MTRAEAVALVIGGSAFLGAARRCGVGVIFLLMQTVVFHKLSL